MPERICPVCEVPMKSRSDADITMDVCPQCGGVYLEEGELNAMATGVSGDIEHLTADDIDNDDRFPNRHCPNCRAVTMRKMELVGYSGVVFDYCESCHGFFLDRGELHTMNKELTRLAGRKLAEEYRGEVDGYLVRKDRSNNVSTNVYGPFVMPGTTFNVRMSVYFHRPLDAGLRITSEGLLDRAAKMLHIQIKQDIEVGNARLDGKVIIQADSPDKAKAILSQRPVADAIADYVEKRPRLFTYATKLEVLDDSISCIGGPYVERLNYDVDKDPEGVVKALIRAAKAVDGRE